MKPMRDAGATTSAVQRKLCANSLSCLSTPAECVCASLTSGERLHYVIPSHQLYRNERKPTDVDKKVLVWAGRYKNREEIPEYVSWEVISAARSNVRIKICMAMILFTIVGCVFMVRSGKKALKEDNTLLQRNIEKKAKWREEAEQEQSQSLKSH
ncbi:protein FAM162B-like isoform X1 [Dendrobates tinctorius]|uniref:protein FAM162B-like isoform X1 n=1 Tax=Dendrobates tinctorius TaxID=92724 RepID=UPI003CCA04CB